MANSFLKNYAAQLAGRGTAAAPYAAVPTGMLYQQMYSRSYLPYMRTPSNKVSRAVAQTAGVGSTFGYGDDEPSAADLSLRSSGDRIKDDNSDGIPDHINLVSGTGDTFRVLNITPGVMADLAAKYDEEAKKREEDREKKYDSKLESIVAGTTSYLKEKVAKEAGKLVGIPDTRFDIVSGREVLASGLKTGLPLIDFAQPIGQKIYEKQILPDLEAAAANAALGKEGFGVFTLGGGNTVAMTPDGIKGNISEFLNRTGRTRTQLENELRDNLNKGLGGGYLSSLYQAYTTPVTTSTSVADIRGRTVYEDMILGSTLSDDLKSEMLGGADLRTKVTDDAGYEYTGFAGTVRFDASTGEVIKDNTPKGTFEEYYFTPDPEPDPPPPPPPSNPPSYENTNSWNHGDNNDSNDQHGGGNSWDPPSSGNDWSSYIATGGQVTPKRDMSNDDGPLQKTGFVAGSPDMFSESETVADTEYRMVRDGSFVLNAPTVENLQKTGLLPLGVDKPKNNIKIKADKGGLISVALSKGEVVLEPEEAALIGYKTLEQINDLGKPEVDRRQANMGGRIGLASGGFSGSMSTGRTGFLRGPLSELKTKGPQIQYEPPVSEEYTPFIPNLTPFEKLTADLLLRLEGNEAKGYVPKKTGKDLSGVSVGLGFDIGQHSVKDLERMGFNSALISKFTPYLNKTGDDARATLRLEPLELTADELAEVNQITLRSKIESFDSFFPEYKDVNDIDRAVLVSADWIGGMRPTEEYPKGRYIVFKNKYEETLDMDKALTRGLLQRITKGDAEFNRAKKAKDWLQQTREAFRRSNPVTGPTPRPN